MHILFYVLLLGKSHIDFTDSLIETLVENGHTVDLIIAKVNSLVKSNGTQAAARKYVYGFTEESPWSKTPHLMNPFESKPRTWKEHVHFMSVTTEVCEIGLKDPGLHQFIASQKYDIGISTEYEYCGFALMKHYKVPVITSVSSMSVLDQQAISAGMANSPAVTHALFEVEDLTTLWGRFKNFINWAHINYIIYPYCQKIEGEVIRKYLGDHIDLEEVVESIDLAFLNANDLIERPRAVSHRMKYIGGINLRAPKKLDEQTELLLATPSAGVVVFCFGTQVPSNAFPVEVKKAFANAFRHFPEYTFLWKYDLQDGDRQIFSNTTNLKFMKWLPQTDLLNDPRTRAFISHVGLNSYMEASFAGVPILAVPLFVDQPHNAKSGEAIGTTYILDKTKITTKNVVKGLEAVLHDPSYSLNAKRISKMLQERPDPPKKMFIEWLEFAAKNPLLHRNLNLAGQNMSIFQYYCIDIILIILAIFLFSGWILLQSVGKLARRVTVQKIESSVSLRKSSRKAKLH